MKPINEEFGISKVNKLYTNIIYNMFEDYKYGEFTVDLENTDLPLNNCLIKIIESDKYKGISNPTYTTIKDDILYNMIFEFEINKKFVVKTKIKEIISHEINHCIEYYKFNNKKSININVQKTPNYILIRKSFKEFDTLLTDEINRNNNLTKLKNQNTFDKFNSLIYYSLDTEYNARISQLYQYLKSFNSKNYKYLLTQLHNSPTFSFYQQLETFNSENFVNEMINLIDKNLFLKLTNNLNEKLIENNVNTVNGYNFIKIITEREIYNYYKKWENIFKIKNKKHMKKMKRIIIEIMIDDELKEHWKTNV